MAKKLYMLCNAHIDPVWQWEWEEGAAETLSTFRIAADFCEAYDGFIFCHNEALLYKWVEEYDPTLFKRIQDLVRRGKWHIMGGWHLQPDCNMPSGEGFVRQIQAGRRYFSEKFGKAPTVAVNVDPFGHSRGLVQIMAKCGYTGYLFMRPYKSFLDLPAEEFRWIGYDGSQVTAVRLAESYNSPKGHAAEKVRRFIENCPDDDIALCLWGVGNHGGGPSKKDLDDLSALAEEMKASDVAILHSTPEEYFAQVNARKALPAFSESLRPWGPGCYTTQIRIKQKYRLTENTYFLTEMMCSHASSQELMPYPQEDLERAMYDLLTVQFHDILPGTSVQPAEEMALRMLDHALEILSRLRARALFALASGQPKAAEDKIPVFAYNPYPYPIEGDYICEFMLWDQIWDQKFLQPVVYNAKGEVCAAQCEKENSSIPLEWRKRIVFHAKLEPMSVNRFDCGFQTLPKKPAPQLPHEDDHYVFDNGDIHIEINRHTGLVDVFADQTRSYLGENAFSLDIYADNFDPWYMNDIGWGQKIGQFTLLTPEETAEFCCTDAPLAPVHVIESGETRTVVESVFGFHSSRAVVKYTLSQKDHFRVDVRIHWNEKQKLVKLRVPSSFGAAECIGEQAYGREVLKSDGSENIAQQYVAICSPDTAFVAVNNGTYGSSFDREDGALMLTLLRSPSYCAHPVENRTVMPQDRYMPYIEQGERDFSFMFFAGDKAETLATAARRAQHFNMQPVMLSFYPTGTGALPVSPLRLEGSEAIQITAFKRDENGAYIIRLFNSVERPQSCVLSFESAKAQIRFGAFEIKTFCAVDGALAETNLMDNITQ